MNGPFRVGIEFFHDGPPSIARDADGTIASDRNFICANLGAECVWFRSSTLGVTGDWVIRATIVPEPGQIGLLAGFVLVAVLARSRGSMSQPRVTVHREVTLQAVGRRLSRSGSPPGCHSRCY